MTLVLGIKQKNPKGFPYIIYMYGLLFSLALAALTGNRASVAVANADYFAIRQYILQ